ncbi:MAG: response regulator, partial [Thiovulaceae bacterium]|nr:response regulator [Sulfurimonadaceae bacterium]
MQSKISILIVEDTKFINHFLKEFFTKSGYEVFQAFTLSEAESTLNSYDINYVLLDLILPDGEGEVLLKVILEKSASSTKIIALTSDNDIQRRHSFLELGALDYFIKDEHLETICSKIDGLIQNVEENYHYNILIVDDSDFSRRLIKSILNTRNYATVTARNGELALNIINSLPVDLMILDYEMPGMNGYELLVEMKKSKNLSEIPVIMVSGSQDKDLIANILKLGARDFIRKPFAMQEILIRVDSALFNKKSLNRLDEQKRFFSDYQDIVNQTDIVIELDMTCNIINSNAIFSKKTGFEKFYLIGKNINTITVSNELDCNELLHSLNPGMIWQGRLDIKKDDGTVLYVDATFAMIDNRENIALTYIGLFHDVSKLVDAEYRAQKAIQSKASFLANMSHEIRTPLNAVVGFLSLLKNKEEEPTKLKYIETIQGASDTLLTVINDILDFSKIESGKLE